MTEIFSQRYSCRSYSDRRVDNSLLMKVLEAARLAPSAVNRQPWTFLVVDSDEGRQSVLDAYPREWIGSAPVFIIAFGHHDSGWHRPADGKDHTDIDVAIAVEHICLAATALGLATCWVCNFDAAKISSVFNAPSHMEPIAIIPIGYASPEAPVPSKIRKAADDIVKWNTL